MVRSRQRVQRRGRRVQPKSASSPFPPVHGAGLEGPVRVDLARSPSRRRVATICANWTVGVDVERTYRTVALDASIGRKATIGRTAGRGGIAGIQSRREGLESSHLTRSEIDGPMMGVSPPADDRVPPSFRPAPASAYRGPSQNWTSGRSLSRELCYALTPLIK
jgi:hypothetical protein